MVADIVEELRLLETQSDVQMSFGGLGGKIKVTDPNPFTILFDFLYFEPCGSKLTLLLYNFFTPTVAAPIRYEKKPTTD